MKAIRMALFVPLALAGCAPPASLGLRSNLIASTVTVPSGAGTTGAGLVEGLAAPNVRAIPSGAKGLRAISPAVPVAQNVFNAGGGCCSLGQFLSGAK